MQPGSSPDLSRGRLRDLAAWIRDDLDPVIAREGPAIMLPDDVLMLNEIFVALHASQTVTANTLRYTGIHRAIMLIRGKATRWPGRLVDQCDMIVDTWTENFGPLDNLRPFLFGRGGRLEGIARPGDRTRKVRKTEFCYTQFLLRATGSVETLGETLPGTACPV